MTYETWEQLRSGLIYRIDRIKYHAETPSKAELIEILETVHADLGEYDEYHSECVSYDRESELVTEVEDLQAKIERLEAELDKRPKPRARRTLGELRACARSLAGQVLALESRCDDVAYRLNRTERYTPEWDALEPEYDRLKAKLEKLQTWQEQVESAIAAKRGAA